MKEGYIWKKKELQQIYNECIDELARYTLAEIPVNQQLLDIIAKLEKDMRDRDILEAMDRINKNSSYIELHSIFSDVNYFNSISKDNINLILNKELYDNLLKSNTTAADFNQPISANSRTMTYQYSQYIDEKIAKMTCPKAAESTEINAAQYRK